MEPMASSTYTSLATVCSPSSRLEPFSELLQGRYPVLPLAISAEPDFDDALSLGTGPSGDLSTSTEGEMANDPLDTPHPENVWLIFSPQKPHFRFCIVDWCSSRQFNKRADCPARWAATSRRVWWKFGCHNQAIVGGDGLGVDDAVSFGCCCHFCEGPIEKKYSAAVSCLHFLSSWFFFVSFFFLFLSANTEICSF